MPDSTLPDTAQALQLVVSAETRPDGIHVVSAEGEVDLASVSRLQQALTKAIEAGHHPILLDLTNCSYMDSTGVRTVFAAQQSLRAQGSKQTPFAIATKQPSLLRLFSITRVDATVPVVPTIEAGVDLLAANGTLTAGPP